MPNNNRKQKRSRARSGRRTDIPHPPQTKPDIRVTKIFRFLSNLARSDQLLTAAELFNQLEIATSATSTVRLINAVRLIKMEMWCAAAQGSAPNFLQITGASNSPGEMVSDTQMGIEPAHVVWRPDPKAQSSMWKVSGTDDAQNLLYYTCPSNTVVDVTLELILLMAGEASVAGSVPVGATLGTVYSDYLDGISLAHVVPEDWPLLP
jgi:hypothetical protein